MDARALPVNRPGALWAALTIAIVLQAAPRLWLRQAIWLGWAPATAGEYETATIWGSCLLCAVAAWIAGQPRSHRYRHLVETASRPSGSIAFLPWAYVSLAGLVGYALLAAAMVVAPWTVSGRLDGPRGVLVISVMTVGASAVFWAAVGVWLGTAMPAPLGSVVACVLPYVLYATALILAPPTLSALTLADGRVFDQQQPDVAGWIARAALWACLAAVIGAVVLRMRRLGMAAATALSLVSAVAVLSAGSTVPVPGAGSSRCTGAGPTVCTDRVRAVVLPVYERVARDAVTVLPPAARPALVVQDASLVPATRAKEFVVVQPPVAGYFEPSAVLDRRIFLSRFGDSILGTSCPNRSEVERDVVFALQIWWRDLFNLPKDGTGYIGEAPLRFDPRFPTDAAKARGFADLPPAVRDAWLAENLPALTKCSGKVDNLP